MNRIQHVSILIASTVYVYRCEKVTNASRKLKTRKEKAEKERKKRKRKRKEEKVCRTDFFPTNPGLSSLSTISTVISGGCRFGFDRCTGSRRIWYLLRQSSTKTDFGFTSRTNCEEGSYFTIYIYIYIVISQWGKKGVGIKKHGIAASRHNAEKEARCVVRTAIFQ